MAKEVKNNSAGFGIAGFVCGLIGLIPLFGIIFAILGLIFSIIQLKRNRTGLAIAGLIISIFGIVIIFMLVGITILWQVTKASIDERSDPKGSISYCLRHSLEVIFADSQSDAISINVIGGDVSKIKDFNGIAVIVNGAIVNSTIDTLTSDKINVKSNLNSGDKVTVSLVIGDMYCDPGPEILVP